MLLASGDGSALNVEAHPKGVDMIEPTDGIITHANHLVVTPSLNSAETSPRGDRLSELLNQRHGVIYVDYVKECMSDHVNYPRAICRHPSDVILPLSMRGMTVAGMIVDSNERVAHICAGLPCEGEYLRYEL